MLDSARVVAAVSDLVKAPAVASVAATIALPTELEQWKLSDAEQVAKEQARIREEFAGWFARGYAAIGTRKSAAGMEYLLAPWSDF
jgi:predicted GNAT superfamily acetyltransferase